MYYSNFTKTVLLAAEQSIPRIKHKKIREQSGNPWCNQFCKQAVSPKREKFKKWLLSVLCILVEVISRPQTKRGKSLNVFKIDTSVSRFPSHSGASTAMKRLN